VLLHGRNDEKARSTLAELRRATGSAPLEYHRADFASLEEVRRLAHEVSRAHEALDVLINWRRAPRQC
jgi:NAD(P)-dependent dehydrogenase (short-subunit alcohol dehydrogenase family)